ncbi:hypothetical protein U1Q18_033863 [Sarracenia purpurea var. burkii]
MRTSKVRERNHSDCSGPRRSQQRPIGKRGKGDYGTPSAMAAIHLPPTKPPSSTMAPTQVVPAKTTRPIRTASSTLLKPFISKKAFKALTPSPSSFATLVRSSVKDAAVPQRQR